MNVSEVLPFLICRPESVPLSPRFPQGWIHGGAKSCACISRAPLSEAQPVQQCPPSLCGARSHSPHVAACLSARHGKDTRQGCSATPAMRSPQPCRAPAAPRAPAFTHRWHPDRRGSACSAPQSRRERSNFRLCSEWMTSAHIGNSPVPGSRCDLPVAHLLASAKCKSLRASVSAQYSQEHEGSCAKGRVRAGRQRGALFPPLSGVYGLKQSAYSRGFAGSASSPHPS